MEHPRGNLSASNNYSNIILILWLLVFVVFVAVVKPWAATGYDSVLAWDVFGYYAYLPASILHHDLLHLQELRNLYETYQPSSYFYAAYPVEEGSEVYSMSYTMGLAILYLPFFLLGHLLALVSSAPADGLSWPYQLAIYFGSGIYAFAGLLIIRKVLLRFYDDGIVALCLLVLVLATNYFFYSFIELPMQHCYLFTLYAAMLWLTIRWHEEHQAKHAALLGLVFGLIVLMRPTEIVAALVPVLWGVTNKETLIAKINMVWRYRGQLVLLGFCAFLVGLPQLAYWKYTTGKWLYYSYRGLGFDFAHPHLYDGILSIRKGWLVYTPAMVFAIIGFVPLFWQQRIIFWGIAIYALLNVYIVFSWSVWYYGGGFGARAMVQSYAIMMFPLAAFFSYIWGKRWATVAVGLALCFFTVLNLFQIWQYRMKMYSTEGMTGYVYKLVFFKTKVTYDDILHFEHKEYLPKGAKQLSMAIITDQEIADTLELAPQTMDKVLWQEPLENAAGQWVQIDVRAMFHDYEWSYNNMAKAQVKFLSVNGQTIKKAQVHIQSLLGNKEDLRESNDYFGRPNVWDNVVFATEVPPGAASYQVLLHNPGYTPVDIAEVTVTRLE